MSHPTAPQVPPRVAATWIATVVAALCGVFMAAARASDGPDPVDLFEKEVRPVLVENCIRCHGPDKQKGGLRLDSRGAILAGGESGPAVVPGRPDASLLIEAIRRQGERKMPPKKPLGERQVAALTRWVELEAPWPEDRRPAATAASPSRPREPTTGRSGRSTIRGRRRSATPPGSARPSIDSSWPGWRRKG